MNQVTFDKSVSVREKNLTGIFRKLWEQHIMWTRSLIISTAANLGDLPPVTKRLLQNPWDFANEFRQFYGDEKAKSFAKLLTEHLLFAAKLVNDAKAGNKNEVEDDRKKWRQNADEISDFLAGINPNWSKRDWQTFLYDHLRMTANEANYRLTSQYAADVAQYDSIQTEALKMADYMADGIRKQFQTE
jgi:hypothetical protein